MTADSLTSPLVIDIVTSTPDPEAVTTPLTVLPWLRVMSLSKGVFLVMLIWRSATPSSWALMARTV